MGALAFYSFIESHSLLEEKMQTRTFAMLLLSLGCLMSVAPVQGKPYPAEDMIEAAEEGADGDAAEETSGVAGPGGVEEGPTRRKKRGAEEEQGAEAESAYAEEEGQEGRKEGRK